MVINKDKIKIIFFIGSLRAGGKERRLIELLSYLKSNGGYEILVVFTLLEIHYTQFHRLDIPFKVIDKKWSKYDITVFYEFYKITREFQPDLIHTWGRKQSFYALPAVIAQKTPLINSQITSAPPKTNKLSINYLIDRLNFHFSKIILGNSLAGIASYNPPPEKAKVIYNGINMNRFMDLPDVDSIKLKYKLTTPYIVIMVASVSKNKDYKLFSNVAQYVTKIRDDISFIGVGWYINDDAEYKRLIALTKTNSRLLFPGNIKDVEALVNACTIGVLFSNQAIHGEGISNAIMEYMALSKPVIANNAGGTKEILQHNKNGYLVNDRSEEKIGNHIIELIEDEAKRVSFGKRGLEIIATSFTLEKMGQEFIDTYREGLAARILKSDQVPQFIKS